jgi:lipid A 4'-phosphatase
MDLEQKFLTPRLTVILALGLAAAAVLAFLFAHHDLALSAAARALPDAHADFSFWWLVNYYGEVPTWTVIILAALGYLGSLAIPKGRRILARFRPHLLFLVCTAALGPGLLNQGMKAFFNRPRPAGHDNSFPSGHTAMAFVLLALAFLVPRTKPVLRALAGGGFALWGIAVGAARVVYGAHYPSDVLFGALVTLSVEIILWAAVFRRRIAPGDLT